MITVLRKGTTQVQMDNLISWLRAQGLDVHISQGHDYTILGLIGDTSRVDMELLGSLDIVESVKRVSEPYKQCNRPELAQGELDQVAVMKEYLPKPLSAEEIEKAVGDIIAQTGASSMKDMGRVMGMANKQMAGKADGKQIADIVRRLLAH